MANVISWNSRGIRNKAHELKSLITDYNPVCIALQETYLKPGSPFKIPRYSCFRVDNTSSNRATGGVALLTSHNVPSSSIPIHTSLQAVAVQLNINRLITVCCIYIPPNEQLIQSSLDNLIQQLPRPFILLGDFNGHSPLWGNEDTNSRGQILENFISDNNLCVLNNGENTYFHEPSMTLHALDLALCSPSIMPLTTFWVGSDLRDSDHFPIFLSFPVNNTPAFRPSNYIYDKADWTTFTKSAIITHEMVSHDINDAVSSISNVIIAAADISIPKTVAGPKKHNVPWWNNECQRAKKLQQKAWGRFRRYPTRDNLINFKRTKAEARKIRRRCQRESWTHYISGITAATTSKTLWKRVKKVMGLIDGHQISPIIHQGHITSDLQEIANAIGKTFASISNSSDYPEPFLTYKNQSERRPVNFNNQSDLPYNNPFSEAELFNCLKKSRMSSPGPDGISYNLIKHLPHCSILNLLFLYNRIWEEHVFPTAWQKAIVIPFPKPGKDATKPDNYRPIALTSCICKLFERMVNDRLVYVLEKHRLLADFQSGFRKGRSTIDNILYLETQVREAFRRRNHLVSVFFDMQKAYDRTWRHGILQDLFNMDFRGHLPIFIQNFLKTRSFRVRIGNVLSDDFNQDEGVPQGSVLSVTLFSIKINNILKQLPTTVQGSLYVDDLQISCQGKDMRFIERQLQTAIRHIQIWNNKNGFNFSTEKTFCIHFCRQRGFHPDPEIFIGHSKIKCVEHIRFLGVIFDHKLNFLPHTIDLRKRCERTLNLMKVLSTTRWGADRTSLLRIYRAIVRSKLDYGCPVYGSARKSVLRRLDTVHHTGLRICSGAFRTSPVMSLYSICHEPPLHLTRDRFSLNLYFRILSNLNHPLHRHILRTDIDVFYQHRPSLIPHFGLRMRILINGTSIQNTNVLKFTHFSNPPWHSLVLKLLHPFKGFDKTNTSAVVYQHLFHHHRHQFSGYLDVYTDGSKAGNKVGCGIVANLNTYSLSLPPICSVFTAELTAVKEALVYISKHNSKCWCIYSDSQSVLDALKNKNSPHSIVTEVLSLYYELLNRDFSIYFCWVPGHVGIRGNELADEAAKAASGPSRHHVPYADIKLEVTKIMYHKWQALWDEQTGNKLFNIKPNISWWDPLQSRRADVLLTRLRLGHTRITHKYLLQGEDAPCCGLCQSPLSISHILSSCSQLAHLYRLHFFTSSPSLSALIGESPHSSIFNFLKHSGFYYEI